jgi:hypothetical protein
MPITSQLIGTGITKRISTSIRAPFGEEEIAELKCMGKAIGQKSTFEGIAASWEVLCQDLLAKAKLPPWDKFVRIRADGGWADDLPEDWHQRWHEIGGPGERAGRAFSIAELRYGIDSQEWFAAKILQSIDLLRKVIARGETATATHLALELGIDMATATLKFTWEPDALLGKDTREKRRDAQQKSAQVRGEKKQDRLNKVRKAADEIWKSHPDWPVSKVIRSIRKQEQYKDMAANTLKGDLSKPDEWSAFKSRKQKSDLLYVTNQRS